MGSVAGDRVARRVRELAATYEPPTFDHIHDPDTALFLCAMDHRTGYRDAHAVAGEGPFSGSALLWAVALDAARREPALLRAGSLRDVDAEASPTSSGSTARRSPTPIGAQSCCATSLAV